MLPPPPIYSLFDMCLVDNETFAIGGFDERAGVGAALCPDEVIEREAVPVEVDFAVFWAALGVVFLRGRLRGEANAKIIAKEPCAHGNRALCRLLQHICDCVAKGNLEGFLQDDVPAIHFFAHAKKRNARCAFAPNHRPNKGCTAGVFGQERIVESKSPHLRERVDRTWDFIIPACDKHEACMQIFDVFFVARNGLCGAFYQIKGDFMSLCEC